jgi:hypothetical protein
VTVADAALAEVLLTDSKTLLVPRECHQERQVVAAVDADPLCIQHPVQGRQIICLALDLALDTLRNDDAPVPREELENTQPTFDGEMPQRAGVEHQRIRVEGH